MLHNRFSMKNATRSICRLRQSKGDYSRPFPVCPDNVFFIFKLQCYFPYFVENSSYLDQGKHLLDISLTPSIVIWTKSIILYWIQRYIVITDLKLCGEKRCETGNSLGLSFIEKRSSALEICKCCNFCFLSQIFEMVCYII